MISCPFSSWTLDTRAEPAIRVGVVLPEDGMDAVLVRIPEQGHVLKIDHDEPQVFRSLKAKFGIEGGQVVFLSEAGVLGPAPSMTLCAAEGGPIERGAGAELRGVVTGRGFHWQKRMNPTLCGDLEVQVREGHLLVVNTLPLEDYLAGVIAGEMSGECPLEFLKSQCLVARSWVLARTEPKHAELPIDRCNDDCCQRYHGTTDLTATALEAVGATRGQILVHADGGIIDANYSKSCGGIIEAPEHVWSVSKPGQRAAVDAPAGSEAHRFFPLTEERIGDYLQGAWLAGTDIYCSPNVVPEADLPTYLSKVDEGGSYFRWRLRYDRADLEAVLRVKLFGRGDLAHLAPLDTLTGLQVLRRGASGRVTRLKIDYVDPMGVAHHADIESEFAIRDALHEKFLYSSAFRIEIARDDTGVPRRITLLGAGWGHGAGLCQIGALGMALKGHSCQSIVEHYFEGVVIRACY